MPKRVNIPDVHTFMSVELKRGSEYMLLAAIAALSVTEEHKKKTIEEIWNELREIVDEL